VAMVQRATELQDAIRIMPYGFVPDDLHFRTLWLVYTRLWAALFVQYLVDRDHDECAHSNQQSGWMR
jgi:hypothetical protein